MELDAPSVNLRTAAINSRTGNWRQTVCLEGVASLAGILSFCDSCTKQIKPVNAVSLKAPLDD